MSVGPERARPSWPIAVLMAVVATLVAFGLMQWARAAYQVRTLPERLLEWVLLFIPLDLFERGLQRFGAGAKTLALNATVAVLLLALLVLGALAVRAGTRAIALTTVGLWLFAMGVVMPLTGAGFFATGLPGDVALVNASYLGMALAYATVLLLARARSAAGAGAGRSIGDSRRAFLGGLAATATAYAATLWLGRTAGTSGGELPLASLEALSPGAPTAAAPGGTATSAVAAGAAGPVATAPAGAPTPATAAATRPSAAASPPAAAPPAPPTAAPTAPPGPTAPPKPTEVALPPPPRPPREIKRDQDGSLTASVRKPGELASLVTPNAVFYITTKNAGGDPIVDRDRWRLAIDGEVVRPVSLDLKLLYQLPAVDQMKTLNCISNWVTRCQEVPFGCDLIANATWKGARLRDVLALAGGLKPGVRSLATASADEFTVSLPADADALGEMLLVYEMNGEVLPIEHGYPARILIPGRYGMKNPKWVTGIRAMREVFVDWYGQRNWSKEGIVKTWTRIDVPADGARLPPGEQRIAGIAYAGDRGVSKVEYSADGGKSWKAANALEPQPGKDTWLRWEGVFVLPRGGTLQLAARAVDGTGAKQIEQLTPTQPDGGAGLHTIEVKTAAG
ncbi:MAG TPA: molybdopterin-dependent oxidoreductase [Chloroflexota bacterium]|nr:molybdopterin-dependent oxidoreductase [Chloroflexota bacterium]